MNRLWQIWVLLLAWLGGAAAYAVSIRPAQPELSFVALDVAGTVKEQLPGTGAWIDVPKGATLEVGALVQIRPRSALVLQMRKDKAAAQVPITLRLDEPMILRLDQNVLRDRRAFTAEIDLNLPKGEDINLGVEGSLHDAWLRLKSLAFTGQPNSPGNQSWKGPDSKDSNTAGFESRGFSIQAPFDGQMFKTERWPLQVEVNWTTPKAQANRAVILQVQPKDKPAVDIPVNPDSTSRMVTLDEEGTYEIRVVTIDGEPLSKPVTIHSLGPVDSTFVQEEPEAVEKGASYLIELLKPERNLTVISQSGSPYAIEFCWRLPPLKLPGSLSSLLRIRDMKGRTIARLKSTNDCTVAKLIPRGELRWDVALYQTTVVDGESVSQIIAKSRWRRLQFLKGKNFQPQLEAKMDEFMSGNRSATLVIE